MVRSACWADASAGCPGERAQCARPLSSVLHHPAAPHPTPPPHVEVDAEGPGHGGQPQHHEGAAGLAGGEPRQRQAPCRSRVASRCEPWRAGWSQLPCPHQAAPCCGASPQVGDVGKGDGRAQHRAAGAKVAIHVVRALKPLRRGRRGGCGTHAPVCPVVAAALVSPCTHPSPPRYPAGCRARQRRTLQSLRRSSGRVGRVLGQ